LRNLAFGGSKPSSASNCAANQQTAPSQYDSWAEHDKEQVDEIFQKELQQAILMSKVDFEEKVL